MSSILTATVTHTNTVTVEFHRSLMALARECGARNIGLAQSFTPESNLATARNIAFATFLADQRFTHMLFIDADHGFEPAAVLRLLEFDREVVGNAYPGRHGHRQFVFVGHDEDFPAPNGDASMVELDQGFAEVSKVGTGLMLIRRDAAERMAKAYPGRAYASPQPQYAGLQFFDFFSTMPHPETRVFLGDDFAFCHLARRCGLRIFADLATPIRHVGQTTFTGCYASGFQQR